ncbi:hypothetical protein C8R46DRAFT_905544, partial [Mycena filopes]
MRAGRKPSAIATNHFTQTEKKDNRANCFYWKCNYCGDNPGGKGVSIEGRDNNLPSHLADSRKCPSAPLTARNEALQFMADKKKTTTPLDAHPIVNSDPSVIDLTSGEGPEATGSTIRKKRKLQGTLDAFVDQAMLTMQKNNADRKWLRFLIHANVSFRSSEDEFLRDFLAKIRPTYDAPSRYTL